MSDTVSVVAVRQVSPLLRAIALEPPAWTRLEPQSVSGDPAPGLEARVHDPLWLLTRQWQFGEFAGEDAGTPLAVEVTFASRAIDAWQPGEGDQSAQRLGPGEPLEPLVEREPLPPWGPGLKARAEAGALLVTALAEAGLDARGLLLAACPLPLDEPPPAGVPASLWTVSRALRTLAKSCPDGEAAAVQVEGGAPAWLAGASPAAVEAVQRWLTWYRTQVAPKNQVDAESWVAERLEYRFAVRARGANDQLVFRAPAHDGGAVDWYTFDALRDAQLATPNDGPGESATATNTVIATPLRYAGQPSDRLWEFEDGEVNLGRLEVQPHDLARLAFVEFAMIYGNDWFVVPVDVPAGTFVQVGELAYRTTFGDRYVVPAVDDRGRTGRFRMFEIGVAGTDTSMRGLFVPPSARAMLDGRALEDVLFLRDESANMAWAVERTVQDPSGEPRARGDEPRLVEDPVPIDPAADLQYLLATTVPPNWIPLVPMPTTGRGGFVLRKGTMTDTDASIGNLLDPTPFTLHEEEVPREGVRVRRVPSLSRTASGERRRWVARRVTIGRGEGSSGLAFDGAYR